MNSIISSHEFDADLANVVAKHPAVYEAIEAIDWELGRAQNWGRYPIIGKSGDHNVHYLMTDGTRLVQSLVVVFTFENDRGVLKVLLLGMKIAEQDPS